MNLWLVFLACDYFLKAHLMMKSDSTAAPYPPSIQCFFTAKRRQLSGHVARPVQVPFLFAPTGQPISLLVGVDLSAALLNFYSIENLIFSMLSFLINSRYIIEPYYSTSKLPRKGKDY